MNYNIKSGNTKQDTQNRNPSKIVALDRPVSSLHWKVENILTQIGTKTLLDPSHTV